MTLSDQDGKLFYQLWLPLLDYVNQRYKVKKNLHDMAHAKSMDPTEVKAISDKLLEDLSIIDDYLALNPDLPEEHKRSSEAGKTARKINS